MARKIAVEIVGDSSSLERAFKKSAASAGKFNGNVEKVGKKRSIFGGLAKGAGLLTGALGVGGLTTAAKAAFDEMQDGQKVSAQTAAVLKSTKGAANVTAGQVDKLATNLMNLSGTDDEVIKSGENMLLTFTNIRNGVGKGNKIFDKATQAALDMSVATGTDMKTSALQLGKALNDPEKGLTRLQRVGVTFTAGQEKQIKAMVKAGDTAGAQKVILEELNKEFGGSAEAAGKTLPGQLDKLKNNLLNLGGTIAQEFAPKLQDVVKKITDWISKSKNQKKVMDTVNDVMDVATDVAKVLGDGIKILKGAFELLSDVVGGNKNAIKLLIGMYAGFKVVQIAGRVSTLTGAIRGLTGKQKLAKTATDELAGSSGKLRGSLSRVKSIAKGAATGIGTGLRGAFNRARTAGGNLRVGAANLREGLKRTITVSGDTAKAFGTRLKGAFGRARTGAGNLRGSFTNLRGSMIGKAGLVAAAGFAAYEVTKSILKITGLDKKLYNTGAAFYDLAAKIGLVNDQMAQYQGFKAPGQKASGQVLESARELARRGLTPQQITTQLKRQYVNIAPADILKFAQIASRTPGRMQVSGGIHLHGVTNMRDLENALMRRSRLRAGRR